MMVSSLNPDPVESPLPNRIRKRVLSAGMPQFYSGDQATSNYPYSGRIKSRNSIPWKVRIRNTVWTIVVMTFPLTIFVLPMWWRQSTSYGQQYPRVAVSLTTVPERLPHLKETMESILFQQTLSPTTVYLVLPRRSKYNQGSATSEAGATLNYEPFPTFVEQWAKDERVPLEILRPDYDYGPISRVLYALEEERDLEKKVNSETADANGGSSESSTSLKTTSWSRLVYLDDDTNYDPNLLQSLVDASLQRPQAVVAQSGGKLRDKFRQIKHSNIIYDKFPNLFAHGSGNEVYPGGWLSVDIVQGSAGVCLVPKTLLEGSHGVVAGEPSPGDAQAADGPMQSLYSLLNGADLPTSVVKSDDVVLSAWMESLNVTRSLVPVQWSVPLKATDPSVVEPSSTGMHKHLVASTYYLQQHWNIWSQYDLLNPSELTQEQQAAMDCEAAHEQDCQSLPDRCLPSPKHCPDAQSVLESLSPKSLVTSKASQQDGG